MRSKILIALAVVYLAAVAAWAFGPIPGSDNYLWITTSGGSPRIEVQGANFRATGTVLFDSTLQVTGASVFTGAVTLPSGTALSGGTGSFSSVTDTGLVAGRVTFAGTNGLLSDDSDMTFSGSTLTATNISGILVSTSVTDSGIGSGQVLFGGAGGLLTGDAGMTYTFASDTLTVGQIVNQAFTGNVVTLAALSTPSVTSVTPQGTPGGVTYGYKVVAYLIDGTTHTAASAETTTGTGHATLDGTNFNRIMWGAVAGATSYDVYRTTGGAAPPKRIAVATTAVTLDDTGIAGTGTTPPVTNTIGGLVLGASLINTPQAFSIADDLAGSTPEGTLIPSSGVVLLSCLDPHDCTVVMSEANAVSGNVVKIVGMTAATSAFADTSGVSETTGAITLGQYDSLSFVYATDRWVELGTVNN